MLTVVFLAAIFACFQLLGMWLRLKAMEQKFDYLMELLLAPTTEEQPRQSELILACRGGGGWVGGVQVLV